MPHRFSFAIKATPFGQNSWTTVAMGTWTPGEPPAHVFFVPPASTLPAELLRDLLDAPVSPTAESGRIAASFGETEYVMEFDRIKQ